MMGVTSFGMVGGENEDEGLTVSLSLVLSDEEVGGRGVYPMKSAPPQKTYSALLLNTPAAYCEQESSR